MPQPFDAVLMIAFGGPQAPPDIRPFLANVLRGRRVAPGRVEEVAHHYEVVGGRSPITELTVSQAEGLRQRLAAAGTPLPVFVGMRNWHPYLADTLESMAQGRHPPRGRLHRRGAPQLLELHAVSRERQGRAGRARAARAARRRSHLRARLVQPSDVHRGERGARRARDGDRRRVDARARSSCSPRTAFPSRWPRTYPYRAQFEETARLVADASARQSQYATVYQSRSGRPEDPWLGPDICDYLREARAGGLDAAVLSPIGFVCDHVEVLYDLDVEAREVCREIGLPMVRAQAVNDHPRFLDMMADVVLGVCRRYEHARPLELVPAG